MNLSVSQHNFFNYINLPGVSRVGPSIIFRFLEALDCFVLVCNYDRLKHSFRGFFKPFLSFL